MRAWRGKSKTKTWNILRPGGVQSETIWGRGVNRVQSGGLPQSQPPPQPPPPSEQQFPQKSQPNNIFSQNLINCLLNTNYALAGGFIPKNAPSIFEYDKLSDVAKTRVQWRSNFQSGSRVLKRVLWTFSYLYLWHTIWFNAKKCSNFENRQFGPIIIYRISGKELHLTLQDVMSSGTGVQNIGFYKCRTRYFVGLCGWWYIGPTRIYWGVNEDWDNGR